jgi:hypothetical protein
MQNHTSEFTLATTAIALGFGKIMELLVVAEPVLAALSYIVAIIAGLITIYYKLKRRG